MCAEEQRIEEGDNEQGSSFPVHCTSWWYQDVLECERVILVEQYEARYHKVCVAMLNLPTGESKASEASKNAEVIAYGEVEVG